MIIRLLVFIAAMCFAGAAQAQNNWSAPASACTPTSLTIKFDRHTVVGTAAVQHAPGNVDLISLYCQVARFNSGTGSWNLRLTYRDSTGTGATAFVRANIYRMTIGSSSPVLLATANSNSSASTTVNNVASPTFTHTFDFEANIYWVRIDLDRTAANEVVIAYAVVLDGTAI